MDLEGPELDRWAEAFAASPARFARCCLRAAVRARSRRYLHGLLAPGERKHGWPLTEALGEADRQGIPRLL